MNTTIANPTGYRDLPLAVLSESTTNPRRIFEDAALKELAESIRVQGILSPLLVRPIAEQGFEIVAGARRYRAAQLAGAETVPVRIVNLSEAEALEAQLIENLQRRDVHPLEEAQGFHALLNLEEPKYGIEQIAAKVGKTPAYVATRARLTELAPSVVEAFYAEEIGVGHALLLAKLQPAQQEEALAVCFREDWGGVAGKAKRILLPVRHLQHWIEHSVLLLLKLAPFNRRDPQLVPAAGSCVDCAKRTGHNKLLFADVSSSADACTDPGCYQAKLDAHVAKAIAAKPQLVQISTAYGQQKEGSSTLPRNKYVEIRAEKPASKEQATRPEFKSCKFTTDAIVADGLDKGELRKVCTEPICPVHHPKRHPQRSADNAKAKAEQEKQRREQAMVNTIGLRTLAAVTAAVPVRLMKRDLLFVVERLASLLDENRIAVVARQHGIRKAKDTDSIGKLFTTYLRRAEESALGGLLVEMVILHAAVRQNTAQVLRDAATVYKVDVEAITLKVRQEFEAKGEVRAGKKDAGKVSSKSAKKAKAI